MSVSSFAMSETVIETINDYYKLKSRYEDIINNKKMVILKNKELSKKDKRRRFLQLNPTCINCKKEGGTLFLNENRVLSAKCGNTQSPCKLKIEIKKGEYKDIRELNSDYNNYIENIKTQIIQTKLNYLFNFTNEEESLEKFEKLRDYLKNVSIVQLSIMKKYTDIFNNKSKENELIQYNIELQSHINNNKENKKMYDLEKKEQFLTDISENYINNIIPLETKIARLNYIYRDIIDNKLNNTFIAQPYSLEQIEYLMPGSKKTEIVHFVT